MPYKRRPYTKKATKPKANVGNKLLVVMRNRQQHWVNCGLAGSAMLAAVVNAMADPDTPVFNFSPDADVAVRVDQIDSVQYFPPKATPPAEPQTS